MLRNSVVLSCCPTDVGTVESRWDVQLSETLLAAMPLSPAPATSTFPCLRESVLAEMEMRHLWEALIPLGIIVRMLVTTIQSFL